MGKSLADAMTAQPGPDSLAYWLAPLKGYWDRQGRMANEGLQMADQGAQAVQAGNMGGLAGMLLGPAAYIGSPVSALFPERAEVEAATDVPEWSKPLIAGGLETMAIMAPGPKGKGLGKGLVQLADSATDAERAALAARLEGEAVQGQNAGMFDFGKGTSSGSREVKVGDTDITYGVGRDGLVEVILVKTPKEKRGQGSARAAMQQMAAEADAAGLRLGLNADPMDKGISKARLEDFYKSLGFKRNAGNKRDFSTRLEYLREPAASVPAPRDQALRNLTEAPDNAGMAKKAASSVDDYGMSHRPPMADSGAPLHDLTGAGTIYPDDVYSPNGPQYYGTGYGDMDRETFAIANQLRGRPNATVTIYRAVPHTPTRVEQIAKIEEDMRKYMARGKLPSGVDKKDGSRWYEAQHRDLEALRNTPDNVPENVQINPGDWVTVNRAYAKEHGESALRGGYKIISKKVRAKDIFTNGDSIHEWGYDPRD